MTTRTHHLRYVALCAGLLLALAGVAWAEDGVRGRLLNALAVAPFAFAGTFLFNRFQRSREGMLQRKKELEAVPSRRDAQVSNVVYQGTILLGVMCIGVAVLAPAHLPSVVWVVPVLAGAAGIHAQAVT